MGVGFELAFSQLELNRGRVTSPYTNLVDTLSLMVSALGLGPQDLSERGAYFREGGLKTGSALLNYKCNKVSLIYFLAVPKWPPPKTQRHLLALP